jgi:hypothetical protein
MGLAIVEFVMELEERFNIAIPDEELEATPIRTPKDLVPFLVAKLNKVPVDPSACATQKAFYAIRHAVTDSRGVSRSSIRPSTPWTRILPRFFRRRSWSKILRGSGVTLDLPRRHQTVGQTATAAAEKFPFAATWTAEAVTAIVHELMVKVFHTDRFDENTRFVDLPGN